MNMERIVLTIGYVPEDNNVDLIHCGDSDASLTMELNFEIIENTCLGIDNDFSVKIENSDLWDHNSSFYHSISTYLSNYFNVVLSPKQIYGSYALLNDEPNNHSLNSEIIDSEAGTFSNENQEHNGKIYFRHYFEEDGEIYDESVCVFHVI
jgi:hypothetical protein